MLLMLSSRTASIQGAVSLLQRSLPQVLRYELRFDRLEEAISR